MIADIEAHTQGNFIKGMVFGVQGVSTKKWRRVKWAAFSSIFWKMYSHYMMPYNIGM